MAGTNAGQRAHSLRVGCEIFYWEADLQDETADLVRPNETSFGAHKAGTAPFDERAIPMARSVHPDFVAPCPSLHRCRGSAGNDPATTPRSRTTGAGHLSTPSEATGPLSLIGTPTGRLSVSRSRTGHDRARSIGAGHLKREASLPSSAKTRTASGGVSGTASTLGHEPLPDRLSNGYSVKRLVSPVNRRSTPLSIGVNVLWKAPRYRRSPWAAPS